MPGTLAATITPAAAAQNVTAAFTAAGALNADAMKPVVAMSAALAGAGALTATNLARYASSAPLTGTGALTATDSQKYAPTPAFSGSGALTATTVALIPITVIGTPAAIASTTLTALPTHAVGDLIIIGAGRNSTAQATKPAAGGTVPAWVDLDAPTFANSITMRTAYFVATANNHTSGAWSGASGLCAIVLRNQNASSFIGAHTTASGTSSTSPNAPAVTMTKADGSSFLLHIYFHLGTSSWGAVPGGYTRQVAIPNGTGIAVCMNSKTVTTSDGAIVQSDTAGSSYWGTTIEILK